MSLWGKRYQAACGEVQFFIYRAMQIGVLLLATGTILGGVWANYSWGRFWGWDPKETWALITLLCYLALLHGRLAGWWKGFGLSVGSVACFLSVLMSWYGVNFVLGKGLHSYGFGTGGFSYVAAFALFEALFVVFVVAVVGGNFLFWIPLGISAAITALLVLSWVSLRASGLSAP